MNKSNHTKVTSSKKNIFEDLLNNPSQNNNILQSIINSVRDAIIMIDNNGDILLWNNAATKILGFSKEEVLHKNLHAILTPEEYLEEHKRAFAIFQKTGRGAVINKTLELKTKRKNKTEIPIELSLSALKLNGKWCAVGILRDISERKKAEEIILQNEEMFKYLVTASSEILKLPDLNSIYKYVCFNLQKQFPGTFVLFIAINEQKKQAQLIDISGLNNIQAKAIQHISGFNPIGKTYLLHTEIHQHLKTGKISEFYKSLADLLPPEFNSNAAKEIENLIGFHKIYSIGITKKTELFGSVHIVTIDNNVITQFDFIELFVKQAGAIIQNRLMQQSLIKSEERFRTIFEQAPMGIALINSLTGHIYEVNSRFAEITGRTMEEIINIDWMSITHPDDIQEDLDKMSLLNSGKINGFNMDKRYIKKDGTVVWINITTAKITVDGKEAPRHLAMIEDITNRKKTENRLKKSKEKLKRINTTKDKLFSIIAHDLSSPFNSILGFSKMLSEDIENLSKEEISTISKALNTTSEHAYNLLRNLLDWSRTQLNKMKANPEEINLQWITKNEIEEVQDLAKSKDIKLLCKINQDLVVVGDLRMIQSVLRNLLTNAIKFTPTGGNINLKVKTNKNYVEIAIIDSGIGIPPKHLKNIFRIDNEHSTPGTNNEKGTGLGLHLCKEFVELNGGTIRAESTSGKGSVFYFTLPLAPKTLL